MQNVVRQMTFTSIACQAKVKVLQAPWLYMCCSSSIGSGSTESTSILTVALTAVALLTVALTADVLTAAALPVVAFSHTYHYYIHTSIYLCMYIHFM